MKMMAGVFFALVAVAIAAPVQEQEPIAIVRSDIQHSPEGGYQFSYETANGITQSETGELREAFDEEKKAHQVVVVRGTYEYPGEEGKPVSITYFADETGFHAEGDTIPKPASRR